MDWLQFSVFFVGVFGLFIWNRTESRNDARHANNLIEAIRQDIKDFHGRLCSLEEKYIQMMREVFENRSERK